MISGFGDEMVPALNSVNPQNGRRLAMLVGDGIVAKGTESEKLLIPISKYGDAAMDFIWRNKGALAIGSVLATFLLDPQVYITGAKQLVVDPVVAPAVKSVNWTLIIGGIVAVLLLPLIVRSIVKARGNVLHPEGRR